MGSNFHFNEPPGESGGGKQPGNFQLPRQSSIYSLTFDEFLSTTGGSGKDFGSMNIDELLKNIWTAEETQSNGILGQEVGVPSGYLQRQGSLTLPRTLSHKTVDEVWRDMSKDGTSVGVASNMPKRQPTLGEVTLEEFLVRAGIVREDAQLAAKTNNPTVMFPDLGYNNRGLGFGYQQGNNKNGENGIQSPNLPLNVNGVRSAQQQLKPQQLPQQPIFPKQPGLAYGAAPMNNGFNSNFVQNATALTGMVGLGGRGVTIAATGSPVVSSDGLGKSNGDYTPSVSPVPYVFNGGIRGRKYSTVEKVVERRQRRMIKNRESAARSRARKQAYTTELEEEVAKLKEENERLQKKQEEMLEMQKNQVTEMMNLQKGAKRRCLRRVQSGPW